MNKLQFKTLYKNYRTAQKALNNGNNDAVKVLWNQSNTRAYRDALMLVQNIYIKARYSNEYIAESNEYTFWFQVRKIGA